MKMLEQIQKDMTDAMRARDERRLSALRMMKTALKLKEVEKTGEPLTDAEAVQVLATMIKQRKDSIEQFTRGGRAELAEKEAAEIAVIEAYMPKAASEDEIRAVIQATITEMGAPTMKDMGTVMKNTMARFQAQGVRADGKLVSDLVKQALTK
jgi:uncharacterized protein YqeY